MFDISNATSKELQRHVIVLKIYSLWIVYLHDDVVDGYVNKFDDEPDETHDAKTAGRGDGDLLEL